MGDMERKITLIVFSLASVLVLAGFAANEKAYAGGHPPSAPPFGDFKCWQNAIAGPTPLALFVITDQFGSIENAEWFQGDYCTATNKEISGGDTFTSPFDPALNQHYQAWFYPGPIPGPGTNFVVNLEIPQFDDLNNVVIGDLDSILVPATKIVSGQPVPSVDFDQHWNCYDIELPNQLVEPVDNLVLLTTQHGVQEADVLEPFLFCAPMEKFDPFSEISFGSSTLDEHMVCYDLNILGGLIGSLPEFLDDQLTADPFGNPIPLPFSLGPEEILCVTAFKSFPVVGGSMVPIDTSALLLAGAQSISMWMIPVVIAGIGIAIFVIKRRN